LKNDNDQMQRDIQTSKMFNKKEEEKNKRDKEVRFLEEDITDLNKQIDEYDKELVKEERKLQDRNLLKKQLQRTETLTQEESKISIDITIAQ